MLYNVNVTRGMDLFMYMCISREMDLMMYMYVYKTRLIISVHHWPFMGSQSYKIIQIDIKNVVDAPTDNANIHSFRYSCQMQVLYTHLQLRGLCIYVNVRLLVIHVQGHTVEINKPRPCLWMTMFCLILQYNGKAQFTQQYIHCIVSSNY